MIHLFADWIVLGSAIYHFVMGLFCMAGIPFISKATHFLYRLNLQKEWDAKLEYAIKPLGAFALWTSLVCGLAFVQRAEEWTHWIKIFLALLFLLRAFFRRWDRELFLKAFGVPWQRSRWNVLFNIVLSLILLASAWRLQ